MPEHHALLGPSSAHRWLSCPGSMCLGKQFEDMTSTYAEEGTLAHSIAELRARKRYTTDLRPSEYEQQLAELQAHPLYDAEMMECTDEYLELIDSIIPEHKEPKILLEERLDYSHIAEGGFGTGDCVIVSEERIDVIDYKHGKGVRVEVKDNPQLKLYGLAAMGLWAKQGTYTDKVVGAHVCQPRNGGSSSILYTAKDIAVWGVDVVKPAALKAQECYESYPDDLTDDMLCAGEHCRFCKAKAICKTRGKSVAVETYGMKESHTYSDEELQAILSRAKQYTDWVADVQEHCLKRALSGKPVPGFKVVNGRSQRVFKNEERAFRMMQLHGYPIDRFYVKKPLTVAQTERLVGKKVFSSISEMLVETKPGNPTLVPESDARQAITGAEVFGLLS